MHVYQITNHINGKIYVGLHAKDDLQAYLADNGVRAHRPSAARLKPLLFRAIRKHGIENFSIKSLVRPVDTDQMNKLEIFFIRTMDSRNPEVGYNLACGGSGGATTTGRKHHPATVAKISKSHTGLKKSAAHRAALSKAKRYVLMRPTEGDNIWCSLGSHFAERGLFSQRYGKRSGSYEPYCKPCINVRNKERCTKN
jgi:group I intron endonuclease